MLFWSDELFVLEYFSGTPCQTFSSSCNLRTVVSFQPVYTIFFSYDWRVFPMGDWSISWVYWVNWWTFGVVERKLSLASGGDFAKYFPTMCAAHRPPASRHAYSRTRHFHSKRTCVPEHPASRTSSQWQRMWHSANQVVSRYSLCLSSTTSPLYDLCIFGLSPYSFRI